jgi:AcrR family transcriptional regulator
MARQGADRRVLRTRAMLLGSLLDLLVECDYEELSVQDIVDRANVGRSTFYTHFLDKRELLLSGVEQLQTLLAGQHTGADGAALRSEQLLGFSLPLFLHVEGNMRFCRTLLGPRCSAVIEPHFQRLLGDLLSAELSVRMLAGATPVVPLDAIVSYIVSAFIGLLRWWMEQPNRSSAEEINRQFRALSLPALTAALGAGVQ